MANLKGTAMAYEPPQTLNIADLEIVPLDVQVSEEEHENKDGEKFTMNTIEIGGKKYRVPVSVLDQTKAILSKLPDTTHITVAKTGTGMATKYTVMPAQPQKVTEEKVE